MPLDPNQPRFLIFARTGGAPRLVGGCGISPSAESELEMGYWIARPYWGLGFATEARSEEHTSELQSLMRISYAVFCLQKKTPTHINVNSVYKFHLPLNHTTYQKV